MKTDTPPHDILVTGGGGFLGGAIVRLLRKKDYLVSSFSRGAYPWMQALGVRQIRGDRNAPSPNTAYTR